MSATMLELARGSVTQAQRHDAECIVIVLEGAWRLQLQGRIVTLGRNEMLRIPAHAEHWAEALADTTALKVFTESGKQSQNAVQHDDPDQYLWGV
ncbi:MAG TPA: cupin domain-containing protein [Candidatus Angelobacter sp.]